MPAEQIGPLRCCCSTPCRSSAAGIRGRLGLGAGSGGADAAPLLDLCDGMRVLDACAAPGGKTAHLLENAAVQLTAIDRDAKRLQRVRENLERLRLRRALCRGDAADLRSWWDGQPFDRVLLDAPCTASGVVRRHPDIKWLRRPQDDLTRLAASRRAC